MEDIILYPGVELEDSDEAMEEEIMQSEEMRIKTEEIETKPLPNLLHRKRLGELINGENEVIDLYSDSDIGEDFHAVIEGTKYKEKEIKAEKMETISIINSPVLSQAHQVQKFELIRSDETYLLSLCRLCAIPCNDMIHIFGSTIVHRSILKKIQHCLPIIVNESDTISKQVCRFCLEKLESCYRFYETVTQAEKQLLLLQEQTLGRPNKDTEIQDQISSNNSGQRVKTLNTSNEETVGRSCDEDANQISRLDEGDGESNSRCENQTAEPPIESLNSGETSGSISKEGVCNSAQNSSIPETVHSEKESRSDKDASDSVNYGSQSTMRESIPKVASCPAPTKTLPSVLEKKTPEKYESRNDNRLPCDEVIETHATAGQGVCSQMIKCYLCKDAFQTISECCTHAPIHASENYYPCCFCDEVVTTKKEWEEHWSRRHDNKEDRKFGQRGWIHRSNECGKNSTLEMRRELQSVCHKPAEHRSSGESNAKRKERVYKCTFCKQRLSSKVTLERHEKFCLRNNKEYICDYCGKEFDKKIYLTTHILGHIRKQSYSCDICLKIYKSKITRDNYCRINGDKNLFKCSICDKPFASHLVLKEHERNTHFEKKPYFCSLCEKWFNNAISLKRHVAKHANKGPYVCDVCGADYVFAIYLERHKKNAHELPAVSNKTTLRASSRSS